MKIEKLNCSACGAPITIPEDLDILYCNSCGSKLAVNRGEGYVSLKLIEKVTQALQESGEKARSAINENTFVTKVELKKVQISQSISTEEMKLNSLRQEIRGLIRKPQISLVERSQLAELRVEESNSLMRIRKLNMDSAKLEQGWEESLELFRGDLAVLDEIIAALAPYQLEPQIDRRLVELRKERVRCQKDLDELETRLILRELKTFSFAPLPELDIVKLDELKEALRADQLVLSKMQKTPIRNQILDQVMGIQSHFDKIYPRKKVESEAGELQSLDLTPPFPEEPSMLAPMIGLAQTDLDKVRSVSESPVKHLILEQIKKTHAELVDLHDKDLPALRRRMAEEAKRRSKQSTTVFLVILGIIVVTIILFVSFRNIKRNTPISNSNQFVSMPEANPQKNVSELETYEAVESEYLEIVAQRTYLRFEPDIKSKETTPLYHGDLLINLGIAEGTRDWYKVQLMSDGTIGYLYEQWVSPMHTHSIAGDILPSSSGSIIYAEDFSSSTDDWVEKTFTEEVGEGSLSVNGGVYRFEVDFNDAGLLTSDTEISNLPEEYEISVDARWISGVGTAYYGLITNWIDDDHYDFFLLSSTGNVVIGTVRGEETWSLYDTTDTPNSYSLASTDNANKLSVSVKKDTSSGSTEFVYAINEISIFSIEYERAQDYQPRFGLITWMFDRDESAVVDFDNFSIID